MEKLSTNAVKAPGGSAVAMPGLCPLIPQKSFTGTEGYSSGGYALETNSSWR